VDRAISRYRRELIHTSRVLAWTCFLIFNVTVLVWNATALHEAACHVRTSEVLALSN